MSLELLSLLLLFRILERGSFRLSVAIIPSLRVTEGDSTSPVESDYGLIDSGVNRWLGL